MLSRSNLEGAHLDEYRDPPNVGRAGAEPVLDAVGDLLASNISKRSRKPCGDRAVSAVEQSPKDFRSVGNHRQRGLHLNRMLRKVGWRAANERGG